MSKYSRKLKITIVKRYLDDEFDLARSVFYYHCKVLVKPDTCEEITAKIREIFHLHKGRYGYRHIVLALRNLDLLISHKKVQRLMQKLNLKSKVRPKRYDSYKGQKGNLLMIYCNVTLWRISLIRGGLPMLLNLM